MAKSFQIELLHSKLDDAINWIKKLRYLAEQAKVTLYAFFFLTNPQHVDYGSQPVYTKLNLFPRNLDRFIISMHSILRDFFQQSSIMLYFSQADL